MSHAVSVWHLNGSPDHVGCVTDKDALGQVFLQIHFSPVSYHSIKVSCSFVTEIIVLATENVGK